MLLALRAGIALVCLSVSASTLACLDLHAFQNLISHTQSDVLKTFWYALQNTVGKSKLSRLRFAWEARNTILHITSRYGTYSFRFDNSRRPRIILHHTPYGIVGRTNMNPNLQTQAPSVIRRQFIADASAHPFLALTENTEHIFETPGLLPPEWEALIFLLAATKNPRKGFALGLYTPSDRIRKDLLGTTFIHLFVERLKTPMTLVYVYTDPEEMPRHILLMKDMIPGFSDASSFLFHKSTLPSWKTPPTFLFMDRNTYLHVHKNMTQFLTHHKRPYVTILDTPRHTTPLFSLPTLWKTTTHSALQQASVVVLASGIWQFAAYRDLISLSHEMSWGFADLSPGYGGHIAKHLKRADPPDQRTLATIMGLIQVP